MKAAICDGPRRELVIRELPIPAPGPGQLLVKLESCGVCHSDLHIREGDESLPPESYPLVLGHEGIGHVVEVGGVDAEHRIGTRAKHNRYVACTSRVLLLNTHWLMSALLLRFRKVSIR